MTEKQKSALTLYSISCPSRGAVGRTMCIVRMMPITVAHYRERRMRCGWDRGTG